VTREGKEVKEKRQKTDANFDAQREIDGLGGKNYLSGL